MPTYEYQCTKCDRHFEIVQKITDAPRRRCPDCRGKVIRLISGGGGILLKGSGFYATDYRSPEYKRSAEADKPKASPSDGKEKKTSNA